MNWIAELLPLFFVRWFSERYLMRQNFDDRVAANPRPGVFIEVTTTEQRERKLYEELRRKYDSRESEA